VKPWLLALGLALVLALQACHSGQPKAGARYLELRPKPASPASLVPGSRIEIAAVPIPGTELQWVSGTVKLFGSPTLAFKKDAKDGYFKFKTMVPPMVDVPAGSYEVRAWGRTAEGEAVEGRMDYEVR
jgi:hypothetical protein